MARVPAGNGVEGKGVPVPGNIDVLISEDVHVGEIHFNRPEKLNAITPAMASEFYASLDLLAQNPQVSCILLAGRGRAFSVGHDLSTPRDGTATVIDDWRRLREQNRRIAKLQDISIPIVAAVHGYCFGAACLLATFADVLVAAESLEWGATKFRAGAGYVGPALAPLIGHRKARELEYRNGQLTGIDALEFGWANYVVAEDEVYRCARNLAEDMAKTPRELLELRKASMVLVSDRSGLADALDLAALWDAVSHHGESGAQIHTQLATLGLRGALEAES